MQDNELNQLLKNALSTDYAPDDELNTKIMSKVRENGMMKTSRTKRLPMVAACCLLLLCGSATAFAAWKYMTPGEIAIEYGDEKLAAAFDSKDAIVLDESQTSGKYTVTLLGMVSGSNLSGFCADSKQASSARTYAVVAIAKADGTPMPDTSDEEYGKDSFFVSPLIQGLNPKDYNIVTMNGGYFDIVKDGILYRMIECDNIELFADRKLYLSVGNTVFYETSAYIYNEETGEITVNSNYMDMNLLFDLPLNKDRANQSAAEKYLKELAASWEASSPDVSSPEGTDKVAKDAEAKAEVNEILEKWTLVSEEKVKPDGEGRVYYSYEVDGASGDGFVAEDSLFEKDELGYSKMFYISEDSHLKIAVLYYKEKSGEIKVSVYKLKK